MDTVQEFHLELLKNVQFENIRGVKIVADLLAHPGLWSAVFIEIKRRIESGEAPDQFWRLEALYLFTVPGREEELRSLAESWHPVEMHFTCEDDHWNETDKEPFTTNDQDVLDKAVLVARAFIERGLDQAMTLYNGVINEEV